MTEINSQKENKKNQKINRFVAGMILSIITLFLVFVIIFAIGIYGFNWQENITQKVTKIIPYPVVLVNYHFLPIEKYYYNLTTLDKYYKKMNEMGSLSGPMPDQNEIKQIVIDIMVRNELTTQLAKKYQIKVTKMELDQELQKVIDRTGGEEEVASVLSDLYGWRPEDYKVNVLYYYIVRNKLEEKLAYDENLSANREAKTKAEKVLSEVKAGKQSFEELAGKYSDDDETADQGGSLGWFTKGQMVVEFESAISALKKDEVSGLVRTKYGFHIIKLLDVKGEGDNIQWQAKHILIKTQNIDDYINQKFF